MKGMYTAHIFASGSITGTLSMNFPPQWTHAFIALTKYGGDGTSRAGILGYSYRLPNNSDKAVWLGSVGGNSANSFAHADCTGIVYTIWSWNAYGDATLVVTRW